MSNLYDIIYSKKRIYKTALDYQLHQLELAQRSDLRMQNSAQQRFAAKYGWFDEMKLNQAADVRMYRTHNPGFCYHRDGQQRTSDTVQPTIDRTDYQKIMDLLATNGQMDCEKILYLYALSTHPCGPLMAPCKAHKTLPYLFYERSDFGTTRDRARVLSDRPVSLPIFIINLNHNDSKSMQDYNRCLKQNTRLATRLFINKPIILLIQTIFEALRDSNRKKLAHMLAVAKDTRRMEQIIVKPEFQTFMQHLDEQKFLWNSESYDISWPVTQCVLLNVNKATDISIKLVRKIRNLVYQRKDKCSGNVFDLENQVIKYSMPCSSGGKNGKYSDEGVSEEMSKMKFNVEKIAVQLNNKVREAYARDMKALRKSLATNSLPSASSTSSPGKQTSCATTSGKKSGQERVPAKKANKKGKKAAASRSIEFLSNMIEKECRKMREFEEMEKKEKAEAGSTKAGVTNTNARKASFSTRNTRIQFAQYYAKLSPSMPVNNKNLDKIKLDISVNENRKRVKKFLEEPLVAQNYPEE